MKVVYVGRFGQSDSNQDEEAVQHALQVLGHEVVPCREEMAFRWLPKLGGELLLFNKWLDLPLLERARQWFGCVAFWYWDLVSFPDPSIQHRCANRVGWMDAVMPLVDVGFLSDGDWVARYPDKLVWLPQGADERTAGLGENSAGGPSILFTGGSRGCGAVRESFVTSMKARWGDKFYHVERGVHGVALRDLIASSKIVVAPDGPVTDRYWSNRVYNTLGFGAFLLHPSCFELSQQYAFDVDLVDYTSRENLDKELRFWLATQPSDRRQIAEAGLQRTLARHTYRHRAERLIEEVKRRMR